MIDLRNLNVENMKTNNIQGLAFLTEKRNFKIYYKISNGNFPEQQNL